MIFSMGMNQLLLGTSALFVASVVVYLLITVRRRRRSTAISVLVLFSFLSLISAVTTLVESEWIQWPTETIKIAATAAFTLMIAVVSVALVRRIPRAVAFQDYENLRAAAEELRQSKDRFQRAIDASLNGLWEWNIDDQTVWYSPRFRELLGYSTEEDFTNIQESWKSALHPEDESRVLDAVNTHLENQGAYDVEYRLRTRSGEYRWFNARGLAIRDPDGRPYLMSGSLQDIHDRKQAEEVIHRRDEYLTQKQKMEALGESAGETAHEFNNLLQAISGQIQLAEHSLKKHNAAKQELAIASDLIEKSAHFTRQLLDFSCRHSDVVQPTCINQLVTHLAAVARPLLGEQIALKVRVGKHVGKVLADATALQQVLLNLYINARDAMPDGGKLIVSTRRVQFTEKDLEEFPGAKPGSFAKISVGDTGCGMAEDVRGRIFEPFFTTKAVGKGTGLGLALAYSVVKECNGILKVESSPGKGSTFTVWLPVTEQSSRTASVKSWKPLETQDLRRATILYAEDKERVRRATSDALQRWHDRVLVADDGQEAVRLFLENIDDIDLALLDVIMPKMRGDEVYRYLRRRRPNLPIVFCSGYTSEVVSQDILGSGHTWLINKPYKAESLLTLIDEALSECSERKLAHA